MDEKKPEELVKDLEDFEISELDDKDLEEVAGGSIPPIEEEGGGNTNCGCGGRDFTGGSGNTNCGC